MARATKDGAIEAYRGARSNLSKAKHEIKKEIKESRSYKKFKHNLRTKIVGAVEGRVEKQLRNLANKIKLSSSDPDMPQLIR